jgi:serine protease inhibitor
MNSNDLVTGISTPEYSAAFVPFRQPETGMLFVMPETDEDIVKVARKLSEVSILKQFKTEEFYQMDITIPVLDYDSRICMMEPVGPTDLFEFIAQGSQISLDAEGVEIKTQTFHGSVDLCARWYARFDRPFLFYIIDNVNHVVLYSGAVRNPKVR